MDELDIDIDIDNKSDMTEDSDGESELSAVQLPVNFLDVGVIDVDDVKVYIRQDVYKKLEEYAASDIAHELGTILLGDYVEDLGKMHIIISDFIYAKYTDASASTLTFTHETWDYVHKKREKDYPDRKIIGWQHTHPGYGIFLSNYDMFIQENFFNLPFQTAYVIDPVQHLRGFFQWKNGKVERLNGFYIYDDPGKQVGFDNTGTLYDTEKNENTTPKRVASIAAICILSFITLALMLSLVFVLNRFSSQMDEQIALENVLKEKDAIIADQAKQIASIEKNAEETDIDESDIDKSDSGETDTNEADTDEAEEISGEDKNENKYKEDQNKVVFFEYTIQPGDSLSKICAKYNIDYATSIHQILGLNGIKNPDKIYAGQTILLPETH